MRARIDTIDLESEEPAEHFPTRAIAFGQRSGLLAALARQKRRVRAHELIRIARLRVVRSQDPSEDAHYACADLRAALNALPDGAVRIALDASSIAFESSRIAVRVPRLPR